MGRKQREKVEMAIISLTAIFLLGVTLWSSLGELRASRLQELADKERAKRSAYIAECLYGLDHESCKKEISWR